MSQTASQYYRQHAAKRWEENDERLPSAIFFESEDSPADINYDNGSQYFMPAVDRVSDNGKQYYRYLPLLGVSMNVNVHHTISRTVLKQTFHNRSNISIVEATYSFPLYDGSTVIGFICEIGTERLLEGHVKPKDEAQDIYKKEIAEERTAALLQEHTTEVFEVCIGNVPPRTTIKVEIIYLTELKADIGGQGLTLTIPTSIAPRYGSPPASYSAPNVLSDSSGLEIVVDIHTSVRIQRIESSTHPISVETDLSVPVTVVQDFSELSHGGDVAEEGLSHARARLSNPNAVLGKDFVLVMFAAGDSLLRSQAVFESAGRFDDESALMVSLSPLELLGTLPVDEVFDGEILFIADRSGSMGPKMDNLRRAMTLFLKSLPKTCRFNITSFGSDASNLWSVSKPWSEDDLGCALQHVHAEFHANMGGTNIQLALLHAIESRASEGVSTTQVIIVTDGEVWNIEDIEFFIATVRSGCEEKIRFFALGLGDQVSHSLIQAVATAGGGFGQVLANTGQSALNRVVIKMLEGVMMAASWDCEISFEQDEEIQERGQQPQTYKSYEAQPLMQAPFKNICLHPFNRRSVFYLLRSTKGHIPKAVIVKASCPSGQVVTHRLSVTSQNNGPSMIHELAAKAVLLDLQDDSSWLHSVPRSDGVVLTMPNDAEIQIVAEQLGSKYNITSKWTSFVAVDKVHQRSAMARFYEAKQAQMDFQSHRNRYSPPDNLRHHPDHLQSSITTPWVPVDSGRDHDWDCLAQPLELSQCSGKRRQNTDCYEPIASTNNPASNEAVQASQRQQQQSQQPSAPTFVWSSGRDLEAAKYSRSGATRVLRLGTNVSDLTKSAKLPKKPKRPSARSEASGPLDHDFSTADLRSFESSTSGSSKAVVSSHDSLPKVDEKVSLDDLVALQQSNGSFTYDLFFEYNLKSSHKSFDRLQDYDVEKYKKLDTAANAHGMYQTILAVLYLMVHCEDQEAEWKFIVRKALAWLKENGFDEDNFKQLVNDVMCPMTDEQTSQ